MGKLDLCGTIGKQVQVVPRVNLGTIKMKFANKNNKEKKKDGVVQSTRSGPTNLAHRMAILALRGLSRPED
jgi:hypothetical protein